MSFQNLNEILGEIEKLDFNQLQYISEKIALFSSWQTEQEGKILDLEKEQDQWKKQTFAFFDKEKEKTEKILGDKQKLVEESVNVLSKTFEKNWEEEKKALKEWEDGIEKNISLSEEKQQNFLEKIEKDLKAKHKDFETQQNVVFDDLELQNKNWQKSALEKLQKIIITKNQHLEKQIQKKDKELKGLNQKINNILDTCQIQKRWLLILSIILSICIFVELNDLFLFF